MKSVESTLIALPQEALNKALQQCGFNECTLSYPERHIQFYTFMSLEFETRVS